MNRYVVKVRNMSNSESTVVSVDAINDANARTEARKKATAEMGWSSTHVTECRIQTDNPVSDHVGKQPSLGSEVALAAAIALTITLAVAGGIVLGVWLAKLYVV